jgi:hypothetical protein
MNREELLQDIKSCGYWRIEIHSTEYQRKRLQSRAAMQDLVSRAMVSLRGWPYPYYRPEETTYSIKWLEGQVSWDHYREYWRLYESGQWVHYMRLRGARAKREELFRGLSPLPPQHAGYLHVRGDVLFTLTEILHFAAGLGHGGVLDPSAAISVQLHNTKDHMLVESFERFFPYQYVNPSDVPIEQQRILPVAELSAAADETALEMSLRIFEVFGWIPSDAAVRNLAEDQKKLLERRL